MTANRRIALNVVATYGRSLVALACGLLTSRWVLAGLGVEAYGVFGIVGVVISICVTINLTVSASVSRFYAYAFGRAKIAKDKSESVAECCGWFNVALLLHFAFAIFFSVTGLIAGNWAIDNYFNIPSRFISTAHSVLHFSVLGMFIGMVTAPFRAMYVAQQYIAELTVYDFAQPIANVICALTLVRFSGDRLLFFALYTMLVSSLPNIVIMFRAMAVFPPCKIVPRLMFARDRIQKLLTFAGWQFVGLMGLTIRTQGTPVVVNKLLGVEFNSTMTMSSTVAGHAGSLASALNGAFSPAITNAAGAQDWTLFYKLAVRTSKFGALLLAVFAIPLLLEVDYVVDLWLDTPPPGMSQMCELLLVMSILERCGIGGMVAVNAVGKVALHECLCFALHLMTLILCYCFVKFTSLGILGVGWGLVMGELSFVAMRMSLWKWQLKLGVRPWLLGFMLPFAIVCGMTYMAGLWMRGLMAASCIRVMVVSCGSALVLSIFSLLFVLDRDERQIVVKKMRSMYNRRTRGACDEV